MSNYYRSIRESVGILWGECGGSGLTGGETGEAGVQRGRKQGRNAKRYYLSFINVLEIYFQKRENKTLFDSHLASSETSEPTIKQILSWAKNRLKRNFEPFHSGYLLGHEMPSGMSARAV